MITTENRFSKALLHPKYWGSWILIGLLYLLVSLPYPLFFRLGKGLGILAQKLLKRRAHIAKTNLKLCFPHKTESELDHMVRENFISTGIALFETGMAWFWSDKRLKKRVKVEHDDFITEQQAQGKGVILIGVHFLTLELGARILGMSHPGVGVYRPNDNPVLDYVQLKGRLKSNKYMLDRYDTKGMIKALKAGELLWYAPDHDYGPKNSIFAPFFAVEDAATTIGTNILIRLGQPAVIPFAPIRDENGHYVVSVSEPLHDYPKNDPLAGATLINRAIEKEIMKAPLQYMWLHRRFKTRPEGQASFYD